jgi:hypothetical protein
MHARVGDRLCVHGRTVGQTDHRMEIIEVRGPDGGPPYVVRYADGHEAVVFPGPDAVVESGTGSGADERNTPAQTGVGLGEGEPTSFEPEEDTSRT